MNKVTACFGTVDVLNMEYQSDDIKRVVDEMSRAVGELKKVCDGLKMKLVYDTPGLIGTISEGVFTRTVDQRAPFVRSSSVDLLCTQSIICDYSKMAVLLTAVVTQHL